MLEDMINVIPLIIFKKILFIIVIFKIFIILLIGKVEAPIDTRREFCTKKHKDNKDMILKCSNLYNYC
jgi:hypothetical protein